MRRTPHPAGVIVSAAGLRSPVLEQRLKIQAAKALGQALPRLTIPTGLDDTGLSRDPETIRAYREDPFTHDRASLALGRDGATAADWALANAARFHVPLLMVHGSEDPIAYVRGTEEFAAGVGGEVTVHVYEGLLHEPHNEPERDQVISDIIEWLDERIAAD
jgi:alpha-beta hydrolase superfamily lysophospholipase